MHRLEPATDVYPSSQGSHTVPLGLDVLAGHLSHPIPSLASFFLDPGGHGLHMPPANMSPLVSLHKAIRVSCSSVQALATYVFMGSCWEHFLQTLSVVLVHSAYRNSWLWVLLHTVQGLITLSAVADSSVEMKDIDGMGIVLLYLNPSPGQ